MRHVHVHWGVDRLLRAEPLWPWGEPALRKHLSGCEACRAYYDQGVLLLRAARGSPAAAGLGELERMIRRAEQAARPEPESPVRGQRARFALAAAVVLALGIWVFARPAPDVGVVVSGVRLLVDGKEARPGTQLKEGEAVVASGGSAVVRLNGGRVVLIETGARLRFAEGGAEASIESGAGYFRVKKGVGRFSVIAGAATIVVKGTEFLVERKDPVTTHVVVDEGLVEVRTKSDTVQVAAGRQTVVSGEKVSPATQMDLLERIRRGLQRFANELDRALRSY